jgi:hypothetical protein
MDVSLQERYDVVAASVPSVLIKTKEVPAAAYPGQAIMEF